MWNREVMWKILAASNLYVSGTTTLCKKAHKMPNVPLNIWYDLLLFKELSRVAKRWTTIIAQRCLEVFKVVFATQAILTGLVNSCPMCCLTYTQVTEMLGRGDTVHGKVNWQTQSDKSKHIPYISGSTNRPSEPTHLGHNTLTTHDEWTESVQNQFIQDQVFSNTHTAVIDTD
jgi:hypothetical protein